MIDVKKMALALDKAEPVKIEFSAISLWIIAEQLRLALKHPLISSRASTATSNFVSKIESIVGEIDLTKVGSRLNHEITLKAGDAYTIVAQLQLALRHPENKGEIAKVGRWAAILIQMKISKIDPLIKESLDMGWHPEFDVEAEEFQP